MTRCWNTILSLLVISQLASAKVLLIGKNTFLSFDDAEATFTPAVESPGECGMLYAAEPLDACSDLTNKAENGSNFRSSYVLIIRGGCCFEEKVRNAEKAGYKAAIVYNDGYDELLIHRTSSGVHIHGVFVTRTAGEVLKGYVGRTELELWLIPSIKISSWSIMAIVVISFFAMFVVLVTCFFVHKHRMRLRHVVSLSHMPKDLIERIPTEVFSGVAEVDSASVTCVICIDDYCPGDQLRILPCLHKFHALCIDSWLGHWGTFCPVCKRDARTWNNDPPASENTPLLSPSLNSTTSMNHYQ